MAKRIFCESGCAESWREDRRSGLIYGSVLTCEQAHVHNHSCAVRSWYPWHVENGFCPYCRAQVVAYRRPRSA